jgi:hypothetical protein
LGHGHYVDPVGLDLIDQRVRVTSQDGEVVFIVVGRERGGVEPNQVQHPVHFYLESSGGTATADLIPRQRSLVLFLGLGVEEEVSHRLSPGPAALPPPKVLRLLALTLAPPIVCE